MKYYYRQGREIHIRLREDEVFKFELDISNWVNDNGTVTATPTATVRSGSVTAGTPSISGNVITMSLSKTSEGVSRVELKWTDGTYTGVTNLHVRYTDHTAPIVDGYGLLL